jgi:hypothetical protein
MMRLPTTAVCFALMGAPAYLTGCGEFRQETYEDGRRDGIQEAKAYVRHEICLRQQFKDLKALEEASEQQLRQALQNCQGDWPDGWGNENDMSTGGFADSKEARNALKEPLRRWLWQQGNVQPVPWPL